MVALWSLVGESSSVVLWLAPWHARSQVAEPFWCALPPGRPPAAERGPDRPGERARRPKAALDPEEGKFSPIVIACSRAAVMRPVVWLDQLTSRVGVSLAAQASPYPVGQGSA